MKLALPGSSLRRICRTLHVSRSALTIPSPHTNRKSHVQPELEDKIQLLIQAHPTYGYRRLWALLKYSQGMNQAVDLTSCSFGWSGPRSPVARSI